jgi:hypothetical protein
MFENDRLFWFCALAGSGMFVIQFVMFFVGGDVDDAHDGSAHNFKWLSKQAITGFLMMFGWAGLTCKRELGYSTIESTVIGVGIGALMMVITGTIFKLARKLRSTGTVFKIEEAVGKEAAVYQRIPKGGVGKVSVSIQDLMHEIDAVSINGEEVDSFSQVHIVKKADDRTVVVAVKK